MEGLWEASLALQSQSELLIHEHFREMPKY